DINKLVVKKLGLVDANNLGISGKQDDLIGGINYQARQGAFIVGYDILRIISVIKFGFGYNNLLSGNMRSLGPADKFFRFTTEHTPANYFYPSNFIGHK